MRLNDDGKTVAATDLLVPGIGELIGGSQREERLDVLTRRIHELGMNEEEYSLYLDTAPLRHAPPCGLRSGLRASGDVPDGHHQHPRRSALPPYHRQRRVLIGRKNLIGRHRPRTALCGPLPYGARASDCGSPFRAVLVLGVAHP